MLMSTCLTQEFLKGNISTPFPHSILVASVSLNFFFNKRSVQELLPSLLSEDAVVVYFSLHMR